MLDGPHSHHLRPDSHQNHDKKFLLTIQNMGGNIRSLRATIQQHTPMASPEIGKRPQFIDDTFTRKKFHKEFYS